VQPLGKPFDENIELSLASNYSDKINVTGWYASDKLDGIRVLWTGRELYTRGGRKLSPPGYFTSGWPSSPLDGEMCLCPSLEHALLPGLLTSSKPEAYLHITMYVLDAPSLNIPYKQRLVTLVSTLTPSPSPFLSLLPSKIVSSPQQVSTLLSDALSRGHEGIILKNPNVLYERKRCWGVVKVKNHLDSEITPLQLDKDWRGKDRLTGLFGDKKIHVLSGVCGNGLADCQRAIREGLKITIRYCGLDAKGMPRQPVFHRIHFTL